MMVAKSNEHIRVDKEFKKMLRDIKLEKVRNKTSNKLLSDKRLTLALTRVPNLKEFVIKEPLRDENEK